MAASVQMAEIAGHAAVFRQPGEDLGFVEFIEPNALDDADLGDVTANAEHDDRLLLGRTTSGTLGLAVDAYGLRHAIELPDSPTGKDVGASVERGDLAHASFAFTVAVDGDEWKVDEAGQVVRIINSIDKVWDVSVVARAAYQATTARMRE